MDIKSERDLGEKAAHILYPLFVGQFFGIVFTAATFIVVARLLGPVSYGLYVFAFGFSTLVNGFAGFGVGAYFSNMLAKLSYRKDSEGILHALWSGYVIALVVGVILTVFGTGISGYVAGLFPHVGISPQLLVLAALTIVFILINAISVSALIGFSRSGLASITTTLVDLVQLVLSVVLTLQYGVNGAVAGMLIGYIFGAVLGTYFVYVAASKYTKFRIAIPPLSHIWKVFLYVTPIAWTNFLNTGMQNFSILYLGFFVMTAAIGNFGAASKGLALLTMIYSALGSGLFPIFATAKEIDTDGNVNLTYNKIIHFAMIIMLPIVIVVAVMSAPGLFLLVSTSYSTAPLYRTLIAIGTTIGLFGGYVNNLVISEGFTGTVLKINAISAVIQLVAMVILVPWLDLVGGDVLAIVGAILAIFFLGNIVEALMFATEAKKLLGIRFEYKKIFLIYASGFVFGIILAAIVNATGNLMIVSGSEGYALQLVVGCVFALLIYPIILVTLRAMTWHDIRSMRHATMRLGKASVVFSVFFSYSECLYRLLIGM